MKQWILVLFCAAMTQIAVAATAIPGPYDEKADATAAVQQALVEARASQRKVLVVLGANWCKDCRELDKAMHVPAAAEITKQFVVVKVDVGNFDKNIELAKSWGDPIKKGIPAAVVLNADNQVVYATRAGELADARSMGDDGILAFFQQVIAQH